MADQEQQTADFVQSTRLTISERHALARLLQRAQHDIEWLRRRLDVAEAKAEVVAIFGAALCGRPAGGGIAGEDIAWALKRAADGLMKDPDSGVET